jgi:hypothetical protein
MSKLYRSLLWSGVLAAGVAACGDDVTVTPPPPPPAATVHSISVAPNNITIGIGASSAVTLGAAVNADAGIATSVTWSTSNALVATISGATPSTVVVTGVAPGSVAITACSTVNTSVCGNATITVSNTAPTVTLVTVTPSNASYIVGQTPVTYTAFAQGSNNPPQTFAWSTASGNANVVSVGAASGVVTIVAPGTEVIKACWVNGAVTTTVCGSSAVTVQAPAPTQISVQKIEQNNTTVNLGNVAGQVDVTVNADPGAGTISKVQVLIGGVVAAEQTFTGPSAPAAAGDGSSANAVQPITLSLNTAMVKKLANNLFVPVFFNGPNVFSAKLFLTSAPTTAIPSTNVIPVVLQNQDAKVSGTGVVAMTLLPATPAATAPGNLASGGALWFKGNVNLAGGNYVSFFPVTPASATWASTGAVTCGSTGNAVSGTPQTGITFSGTFTCGSTVENLIGLGALTVTPGTAPAADVIFIAAAAGFSQVGTAFLVAGENRWNLLSGGSPPAPTGVWIDNKAPTVTIGTIAYNANYDQKWVNGSYNLSGQVTVVDGGSGVNSAATATRFWNFTIPASCSGAAITSATASTLAETLTSAGADSYTICGTGADNIGNTGASGASNSFGVDKTAPLARLAGSTGATPSIAPSNTSTVSATANTTIYATAAQINNQVWGLEGFDTRSGFNQLVVAGSDAATQTLTRTLQSGVANCAVNDQLTQVLSDSWIRMPVLTLIECGSGLAGYYDYSGNVNDRAGNFSTPNIVRNFAYDLVAPVTSFVSPAQTTYLPGQPAAFNVIASDDLEVLKSYLSFSFTGMGPPAVGITYPYGSFAGLTIGSPWPSSLPISALVPSTGTTGTISIPYLLGRIDESCTGAGVPYPSCGATPGSKPAAGGDYNRDLNLNAPSSGNAAQAPTGIVTNVQDIALRDGLTGAAFSFNPVTFVAPVAQQWSGATAIDTWIGKNGTGDCPAATICADQKTQTSNGLQFFTTVSLWRLNTAINQWTYCADLVPQGPPPFVDNGVYRIWRSTIGTPGGSTTCGALTGFYRVMGTLNGAGLFSPSF